MEAREEILGRLRAALGDGGEAPEVVRGYRRESGASVDELLALLTDRLVDYRARVHRVEEAEVAATIGALLRGDELVGVPRGVPAGWVAGLAATVVVDDPAKPLTKVELDGVGAVLTGCAVAIAETGTIALDGGVGQGRRALSLVPDRHVCVVRAEQVVGTVPEALERLDPTRPLTFISGPSATSDIELNRVEGVHGPRRLDVILVKA